MVAAKPLNTDKLIPHNTEAEQAVLGAILVNSEALSEIRADVGLKPEHFYGVHHQWIYEAMVTVVERGDPIDYFIITQQLSAMGRLADVGGAAGVLQLVNKTPSALNAAGYAKMVVRMWWRRQLIDKASRVARLAHSEDKSIQEIDAEVRDVMAENALSLSSAQTAKQLFGGFDEDMKRRAKTDQRGFKTSLFELNAVFAGTLRRGEYTIIQGLANIGKSFLGSQLVADLAPQTPILYFTFEGTARDVRDRVVSARSGVPLTEIQEGKFKGDNAKKAFDAAMFFANKRIDIVDTLTTIEDLWRHVESALMRFDFERPMVFLDNLNNMVDTMHGDPYTNMNRVSAECLRMCRQLGVGLVAFAQQGNLYNPAEHGGVEKIKRVLMPSMRTIEGSRKLAQHPHNLYGLYSADYIAKKIVRADWYKDDDCPPGHMMFVNCRQRNAPGAVSAVLEWNGDIPRYESKRQPTALAAAMAREAVA